MPHPVMFDEADPLLARVRTLALAFPGAAEKVSHGRPFFHTKTAFAVYGGAEKDTRVAYPRSLLVKPDAEERRALLSEPRCFVPAYLGPAGWVGVDLTVSGNVASGGSEEAVDWVEIAELLDMSFRVTAPAGLVRALDSSPARRRGE
ncbi:MmcQ/YjbR family DNA-binding protein [Rhodococcus yananensis]|uniref:MmcQ/YjbR family DNA-binding protein n=1 Tax=Rhodococcus yananensis TaxID=2879464 RepID=UPI001CF82825|nr:MmcQ/YjbR family DNA-binding protein [Rhodococcus yananensis]